MIKVFLVEDEKLVREGIRDKIPWEQYGFKFVGEAGDGEMALSMIRKTRPDVLLTDIKMPFMDGLTLCKMVGEEFPKMKKVIISGYDDFEYAREAIEIGVDQYLLKPITRMNLRKVLIELKEKIEQENQQENHQQTMQQEMCEYEQFSRRRFFEKLFGGKLSVKEIYDESAKLNLNLSGECFQVLVLSLRDKRGAKDEASMDTFIRKQDEVLHYFLRHPQFILFRLNVNAYGIFVKTDEKDMEDVIDRAIRHVTSVCAKAEEIIDWYVAVGSSVNRLSSITESFQEASHLISYRFIHPETHILTKNTVEGYLNKKEETNIMQVDAAQMSPEIIRDFLNNGDMPELSDFVETYFLGIGDALKSNMFRDYVVLNARFTILSWLDTIGPGAKQDYLLRIGKYAQNVHLKTDELRDYFITIIQAAIEIRDEENISQSGNKLKKAIEYIDQNYQNESLSLSEVALAVDVSSNYLSSVFSQNMQKTFVEYITEKRIEKAKKLLKTTDLSSGAIATKVGYKDSHYFSYVFKKFQGCSPREYRQKKNS